MKGGRRLGAGRRRRHLPRRGVSFAVSDPDWRTLEALGDPRDPPDRTASALLSYFLAQLRKKEGAIVAREIIVRLADGVSLVARANTAPGRAEPAESHSGARTETES